MTYIQKYILMYVYTRRHHYKKKKTEFVAKYTSWFLKKPLTSKIAVLIPEKSKPIMIQNPRISTLSFQEKYMVDDTFVNN